MSMYLFIAVATLALIVPPINLLVHAQTTEDDDVEGWNDSCRDAGFNDGQNGPFNGETYDHCGDEATGDKAYLDGFIDGCMSVEGNTRDVCESATDG